MPCAPYRALSPQQQHRCQAPAALTAFLRGTAQDLVRKAELEAGDCLSGLPDDFKAVLVAAVLVDVAPKGALALSTPASSHRGVLVVLNQAAARSGAGKGRPWVRPVARAQQRCS